MLLDRHRLNMLGLPIIEGLDDLSRVTHLSKGLLYRLSKFPNKNYLLYDIPKPGGKVRQITQPSRQLKAVQSWILRNILDHLKAHPACKGFEKQKNIRDNALPHVGALSVICLDLDDFFPTVSASRVWTIFQTLGYSPFVSTMLTSLCTYDAALPQGSPASPKLANLAVYSLDSRLSGYVGSKGIIYTRYADDLTFSGHSYTRLVAALPLIRKIIETEGFSVNESKTRICGPSRRHCVTGLILGPEAPGIGRQRLRSIRARIHKLCSIPKATPPSEEVKSINGWLAFVCGVDKSRAEMLVRYVHGLKSQYSDSAISLLQLPKMA
jgi:RNA-directed DNA polymerase